MARYPQSCVLKWTGYATSESSGNLSFDYTKGNLNMGAVISGTPIIGPACTITVRPMNFKLKAGGDSVALMIDGGNFDKTNLINVTPTSDYEGKQLNFAVSIIANAKSVLNARVGW